MSLLSVDNLSIRLPKSAERKHALKNLSFELNANEILCIVGESGSGKSMVSNAIMGLLPHAVRVSKGAIYFNERDLLTLPERERQRVRGSEIAMIFQEPMTALNPVMPIGTQLDEVYRAHQKLPKKLRKAKVLAALEDVGLPDVALLYKSYPFALSGGQRQRVMIAMALALEPKILIADEPTTALDVTTQAQILALIKDLQRRKNMGVIFITHDFGVVAEIADRVLVMQHGKLIEAGKAERVLYAPSAPYTQNLIAAVPKLRAQNAQQNTPEDGTPLLQVIDLNKIYISRGKRFALDKAARQDRVVHAANNVNLQILSGQTLGLVGESGSGKSTVGRTIIGLLAADSGKILLENQDLSQLGKHRQRFLAKNIQMIFQDPYASLNPRKNIGSIICEGPIIHGENKHQALANAQELLALVGLDKSALKRYAHEFSGGQRQRIGIARALAMRPKLLIADEAVSALDVSVQAQVLDLLAEIKAQMSLSMLFVTHDLRVAAKICDHVAVMRRGEVVEQGSANAVFFQPQHPYTQQLLASIPGKSWDTKA